jgi:aminomethyltransferase
MAKRTPLYEEHLRLNGRMVEFGGWEMPVLYTGIIEEHNAVRKAAGLFDVSHMGQIEFTGPDALSCVNYLTVNNPSALIDSQAQYSILLNERGTVVDDIIVYRFNDERFIFVVNASNIEKDFKWITSNKRGNVKIVDRSDDFALIAFQGPKAASIFGSLTDIKVDELAPFHFAQGSFKNRESVIAARTGYTGEDGFEIFCSPKAAAGVWQDLLEKGKPQGVLPAGLGARDTLRMEMKYSLYGHEITDKTNPLEAGLGWVVKLDKPSDFIGKAALLEVKKHGLQRKLVGFKMIDRAIPRSECDIVADGKKVGFVTSGTMSPSLKEPIGIGYVPTALSAEGSKFFIDIRGSQRQAIIVKTPFYKR